MQPNHNFAAMMQGYCTTHMDTLNTGHDLSTTSTVLLESSCGKYNEYNVHAAFDDNIQLEKHTPKRRLSGNKGSSVPIDVTRTNFFTFACTAAATRFLVPCKSIHRQSTTLGCRLQDLPACSPSTVSMRNRWCYTKS